MPAVKVNISLDGLKALHGTELPGSRDVNAMYERLKFESEHQPIESYYHRLLREYGEGVEKFCSGNPGRKATLTDKGNILLERFKSIANEISAGYADGTRIRFILDPDSDDGYRKLTEKDELQILLQDFNEFAESRFGKKHQEDVELVMKQMQAVQRINKQSGKISIGQYQPEKIPDGFLDRLLERAGNYIERYN